MSKVLTSGSSILLLFITIASLKSIGAANLYNFEEHNGKISLINNNNAASVRHNHLNSLNNDNDRVQRSVNSNHNYYDQQRNPLDYIVNPSDDNAEHKKPHERIPLFIDGSNDNDQDDNDDEVDDNEEDDYNSLAEIINNNKLSKVAMDKNKEDQDLYYRKRRQVLRNFGSNDKYLDVVKNNYPVKRNVDVMKMMEHQWIGSDSNRPEKTAEQDDLDILFGLHKEEKKNLSEKSNSGPNKKEEIVQRSSQIKPSKNPVNMNSVNPTVESHFSTKSININNKINPTTKSNAKEELTQEQIHITSKKKKNVDWSQYFGIDKRMRQPNWSFAGKPETQKEDDDWLIQHYYQTMADNLNNHAHLSSVNNNYKSMKRNNENKIENIVKYSRDSAVADQVYEIDDEDTQRVKDKILSQLAAAYSLEKMRKALDELKHNIKIHQQGESFDKVYRVKDSREKKNYLSKVNNNYDSLKSRPYFFHQDKKSECPSSELEEIKQHCMPVNNYIGGQMLFLPCIRHQICKMCSDNTKEENKCINFFAIEAARVCDNIQQDDEDDDDGDLVAARDSCRKIAVSITQIQIPPLVGQDNSLCYKIITHSNYNSCLKDFEQQEHHNYFNNNNNNNYYPYKM
ncbi:GSCOCG00002654001-RA-CDS [Cotesia congregata]|nr:GSCOCG00002654001-RA-CDS [Cotesia congregata]